MHAAVLSSASRHTGAALGMHSGMTAATANTSGSTNTGSGGKDNFAELLTGFNALGAPPPLAATQQANGEGGADDVTTGILSQGKGRGL